MDPPGFPYDVIYIGAQYDRPTASGVGYYRVLAPGDSAPWSGLAFITKDEPLVSLARADLERWTDTALEEQPIPVSRTQAGEWQLHAPLFDTPLERSVATAFPNLTTHSRSMAVARLVELADTSRSATASHLLNVRAALDNWLTPTANRLGQTDDLLRMLRPTESSGRSIYIGFDGKAPGFTRVDFNVAGLDPTLRTGGRARAPQREIAQRAAVKRVLEQQGFDVQELQVMRGKKPSHELLVTHSRCGSNKLYYVSLHWLGRGSVPLENRLTDHWFNAAIIRHPTSLALAAVKSALRENRLVRIAAGIQWQATGSVRPSVYFVKVTPH